MFAIVLTLATLQAIAGVAEDQNLQVAIERMDVQKVTAALQAGGNPLALYNGKGIPLIEGAVMSACYEALLDEMQVEIETAYEVVKLLVKAGGLKDKSGNLLYFPVIRGKIELLKFLIENGANPLEKVEGSTLAELALRNSQNEAYQILVDAGATPVLMSKSIYSSLLVNAINKQDTTGIAMLLDAGADVNVRTARGETALLAAILNNRFSTNDNSVEYGLVKYLLSIGADPNLEGEEIGENTPLSLAAFMGANISNDTMGNKKERNTMNLKVIKLLLSKGAKVSGVTSKGFTPLHLAAQYNSVEAAKLLIKEGAKIKPKNKLGQTPLDLAENKEMILLLKKNGAKE